MLTQKSFIRWANEHLVLLVAHNERLHDEMEVEEYGETVHHCTLYPGLRCRDHVRAAVDIDNAREEDLVKVPFVELCPNSWLVLPTGEVERIPEKDQFDPKKIKKQAEAAQKRLGESLGKDIVGGITSRLEEAERASDDEEWKKALTALSQIRLTAPKPGPALRALIDRQMATIDEWVLFEAEDALESANPSAEEKTLVRRLLEAVDVEVQGKRIPAYEKLKAWLGD